MTCAFLWLWRPWKHTVGETNLWGICLHFLCAVTIKNLRILNNKPYVTRRHWLKVKLSFFFWSNLIACYLYSALFFVELIEPNERSVIDSQLLVIKNKPTNSQRSRMTCIEHNFAISPYFLHFPTFSYIKILHSTEGNFLFGSSPYCETTLLISY